MHHVGPVMVMTALGVHGWPPPGRRNREQVWRASLVPSTWSLLACPCLCHDCLFRSEASMGHTDKCPSYCVKLRAAISLSLSICTKVGKLGRPGMGPPPVPEPEPEPAVNRGAVTCVGVSCSVPVTLLPPPPPPLI